MTEPERPAGATSGGPTPEEISARLEALLKRTHALRAERAAAPPAQSLNITWPPPDRELDHYDVVDVPEDDRMHAAPALTPAPPSQASPVAAAEPTTSFARPDWSELRLRTFQDEPPARSPWLGVLTVLLALVSLGEGAYIWYMHSSRPTAELGQLRVDGPDGAEVRVDGRALGPAPIEHSLAPGVYEVEVRTAGAPALAQRVTIGVGRTVVLLPAAPAATPDGGDAPAVPGAAPAAVTEPPASPSAPAPASTPKAAPAPAGVSPTTGAVSIESTPSGLPVTMGGRPQGVTPLIVGQLKPGRHDVLVGGLARQVDVRAGEVTSLRVSR